MTSTKQTKGSTRRSKVAASTPATGTHKPLRGPFAGTGFGLLLKKWSGQREQRRHPAAISDDAASELEPAFAAEAGDAGADASMAPAVARRSRTWQDWTETLTMGWIKRGKSSRTRRSAGVATAATPGAENAPQIAEPPSPPTTPLRLGLGAAALVILCGAWAWGRGYLTDYVGEHYPVGVKAASVELANQPAWVSEGLATQLKQAVASTLSGHPLDPSLVAAAVATLEDSAWVQQVHSVQRRSDGQVVVDVALRAPVAVVEGRSGYHLVDAQGVRLPGLYSYQQVPLLGMPLIVGVRSEPAPAGDIWPGDELQAGLSLVALLRSEPYMDEIAAFDVSKRDQRGRVRLALLTETGMVRWGLPPGQEQAVEPDAITKMQHLAGVYEQHGSIDAGGKIVDIYTPAVYVQTPGLSVGTAGGISNIGAHNTSLR